MCAERSDRLAGVRLPGIENPECSSNITLIQPLTTCLSMSNDEILNLCTCFLSVSLCPFSAFWRAETAISAHLYMRQQIVCSKRFCISLCWY